MSFGSQPAPFVPPPQPQMAAPMAPTSMKPAKKPSQPTVIGEALTPDTGSTGRQRTLIGGASAA